MDVILANLKSEHTKKSYKTSYNKLINSGLFKKSIEETPNKSLIEGIKKITENPNTASALVNICILLKRHVGNDDTELINYRNKLKGFIQTHHDAINNELQHKLPSYDEILTYTEKAYKDKDYLKFIINYLLIHYGVRNQDIQAKIVFNKKDANDVNENYLVVLKNYIWFIRNKYKTVGKYGQKVIKIRSQKLNKSLRGLNRQTGQYLLLNVNGEKISDNSLSFFIAKHTLDGIGETNYAKVLLKQFHNNFAKLQELSLNRGTNTDTLLTRYNIVR